MRPLSDKLLLKLILILGLLIRLFYVFKGANLINKGKSIYLTGDSHSYSEPFINLIKKGLYTFDFTNADAAFGRLPGYPIFWAIHYFIFGNDVYLAVAITQALIDTVTIYLIYSICNRIYGKSWISLLTAFIYATYFFVIVWLPITGTEVLATFFSILFLYIISKENYQRKTWYILLGVIAAACFYVREYLGVLAFITGIYFLMLWFKKRISLIVIIIFGLSFISLYSLWPLRNWYIHNRLILLKPESSGYDYFEKDYTSFRKWMYAWNNDIEPYFTRVENNQEPNFPIKVFRDSAEMWHANHLMRQAQVCGSSFYAWKHEEKMPFLNCNDSISKGFNNLRYSFINREPFWYHIKSPLKNLSKAFFKSELYKKPNRYFILSKILFSWRSCLILLGFIGVFFIPHSFTKFILYSFSGFMYIFFSYYIRHIEIRYFLQADVFLLIGSVFSILWIYNSVIKRWIYIRFLRPRSSDFERDNAIARR